MKFRQDITYTDIWGFKTTCGAESHESPEKARRDAIELARADGWTNPKWWQWWRWSDTRFGDLWL